MLQEVIRLQKEILAVLIQISTDLANLSGRDIPIEEELLDNSDAKRRFKVCDRTLYRWRKSNSISWKMIGNKYYYLKADLIRLTKNIGQIRTF